MIKIIGYILFYTSFLTFGLMFIVPLFDLSKGAIATITASLFIVGEVFFYVSLIILGKSFYQKIKSKLFFWKPKLAESIEVEQNRSFLIIQTAFIGDVILATPVIEKIKNEFPNAQIDFLLRKGNEGLLENHPHIREVIIWDKKQGKYKQLFRVISKIRKTKYDYVINLQRFLTTGIISAFSGGKVIVGFDKNPLSIFFTKRYKHIIDIKNAAIHEVDRNISLLQDIVLDTTRVKPKLYPMNKHFEVIDTDGRYVTISPTSVWFTKQYPLEKWVDVMNAIDHRTTIYLLGGKPDTEACEKIKQATKHPKVENVAGKLSFLSSAALMQVASMNYVNDSAPMHIASAVDASVTAIFCSTIPAFGFGPLSSFSRIVEVKGLECRPCGLHGYKTCPKGHFKCSEISVNEIVNI